MAPRRVWLETYGCQMNKAESESILLDLARDGWAAAGSEEEAELVILNTCSVRETAEQRVRGRLGHYGQAKRKRPFTLVLTGCMAERLKGALAEQHPEIDLVLGTFQKREMRDAVRQAAGGGAGTVVRAEGGEYAFADLHSSGGSRAWVPIMHGCDNFCSYCIVPHVRGREVSRSPGDILSEILRLRGGRGEGHHPPRARTSTPTATRGPAGGSTLPGSWRRWLPTRPGRAGTGF